MLRRWLERRGSDPWTSRPSSSASMVSTQSRRSATAYPCEDDQFEPAGSSRWIKRWALSAANLTRKVRDRTEHYDGILIRTGAKDPGEDIQEPHQAALWGDRGEIRCPGFGPATARPGGGAAGEGGRALLHAAGRGGRRHVARTRRGGGEAAGPLRSDARRPAAQSRRRMGRSRARDAVAQAGRRAASQRHGSRSLSHECPSRYRRGLAGY